MGNERKSPGIDKQRKTIIVMDMTADAMIGFIFLSFSFPWTAQLIGDHEAKPVCRKMSVLRWRRAPQPNAQRKYTKCWTADRNGGD